MRTVLLSWPGGSWEETLKAAIIIVVIYLVALWLTVVFWTYRDIRQRSRDPIVQAVAVLLVLFFFLPGLWIYQILRPRYTLSEVYDRQLEEEALLQDLEDQTACPTCRRRVHEDFLICPSCRTSLKEPCRSCGKALSYAWVACPFCGLEKPPREPLPTRAPRPANIPRAKQPPPREIGTRTPLPAPRAQVATRQRPEYGPPPADQLDSQNGGMPRDSFGRTPSTSTDESPMIDATID